MISSVTSYSSTLSDRFENGPELLRTRISPIAVFVQQLQDNVTE